MDTNAYLTFLAVGVALVVVDGQIIYRSGRRYLEHSYGDPEAGASMTRLITVLFHLAVLGLLAILSTINLGGGSSIPAIVGKLGVMLLLLAVAHGITLTILGRIRNEQVLESSVGQRLGGAGAQPGTTGPTVAPAPDQQGRYPHVSPSLEHQAPYTTPEG